MNLIIGDTLVDMHIHCYSRNKCIYLQISIGYRGCFVAFVSIARNQAANDWPTQLTSKDHVHALTLTVMVACRFGPHSNDWPTETNICDWNGAHDVGYLQLVLDGTALARLIS